MIALTRVRLINWHNFVDDTLEFEKITYLTGVNAVGKTTILDAIRYCLTTSKFFNVLGNREGSRTLQGFVHAKQRAENLYTRRGHTVSYIGVEFFDEQHNKFFVIAVRVESESPEQEMRHVRQTWYISPNGVRLEDLPFIDETTNTPNSRDKFSIATGRMQPIDRQSEAKNMICQRLGIGKSDSPLGKKFNSVFPMGTSLKEIKDFRTFIYEYILPQPVMDLDALQKDEQELENLQETLTLAQHRAQQLKEIVALGEQAIEKARNAHISDGSVKYAQYQCHATLQNKLLSEKQQHLESLEHLRRQLDDAQQQASDKLEAYMQAKKAADESDDGKFLEVLRGKANEEERELKALRTKVSAFLNSRDKITDLLRKTSNIYSVDADLYPEEIRKSPSRNQQTRLDALEREIHRLEEIIGNQLVNLQYQLRCLRSEITELENKISQLERGSWVYPDQNRANVVRDAINKALVDQGLTADARIFCELLYMEDESWQNCVEACLGYRRFDILVSPEHYRAAKHIFENLGETVGRVSLLDTPALHHARDQKVENNSLSAKVSSENPLARVYITELLGNIVCCEASSELENFPHSATRDLLRHFPYRLARLKKQERYIGFDARKQQLEDAKNKRGLLHEQEQKLSDNMKTLEEMRKLTESVIYSKDVAAVREYWESENEYHSLSGQYAQTCAEIEEWEKSPLLRGLLAKAHRMEKEWEEQQALCASLGGDIRFCQNELDECESSLSGTENEVSDSLHHWKQFGDEYPHLIAEVESRYTKDIEKYTPEKVVELSSRRWNEAENSKESFVNNELIPAQRAFNAEFACEISTGIEGIEDFRMQHDQLVMIDLERYSASLQAAKERCRERFRRDILYRMKDDIQNAHRQFRELSRIMKELRYGEETYQFRVRESQNPENARLYSLIMSDRNEQMTQEDSIFNLVATSDHAYEAQVDDFVERILSVAKDVSEARQKGKAVDRQMTQIIDYRHYLDYDIIITNTKTGESVPLSKVSQDSSGGENQAPFYIAICASLLQIYLKCENGIRLVLLDEAFSNMTSDRIKPMMKMFREMGLQVLLITTVEKASAIQPMCDVTYSIVKSGNRNSIAPFYLEVNDDEL